MESQNNNKTMPQDSHLAPYGHRCPECGCFIWRGNKTCPNAFKHVSKQKAPTSHPSVKLSEKAVEFINNNAKKVTGNMINELGEKIDKAILDDIKRGIK